MGQALSNGEYHNTASSTTNIQSTDYTKFYQLKKNGSLPVSNFIDTWKVILLMLVGDHVKRHPDGKLPLPDKFVNVQSAIDQYYSSAFSPEVVSAIEFVKDAEASAELMLKYAKSHLGIKESEKATGSTFQTNLLIIEKQFKEAISSLRLKRDHVLFIDGIDVRPNTLSFPEYMDCIQGLAFAVWSLNANYFANIPASKGRIKIVLLIRPDIFDAVEFQNSNAKIRDNSIVLNWTTNYKDFPTSRIYQLIDGMLAKQEGHTELPPGAAWKNYFNYDLPHMRIAEQIDNPFIGFLRTSFYRPRDIISYIGIMQEYVRQHIPDADSFTDDIFIKCQQEYSDYLLGEVKDHLSFYYSNSDFSELVGFFQFLKGNSKFSWDEFSRYYANFRKSNAHRAFTLKQLEGGPEDFLQFLYSMNVVGYGEKADYGPGKFVHWCFRDRSPVKLSPTIPTGLNDGRPYTVHPGLMRALKLGAAD